MESILVSGTTACWPQGESNEEDYRSRLSLIPMVFVYIITQLKCIAITNIVFFLMIPQPAPFPAVMVSLPNF
uniref:Uncharacterized protein n=1 Tax=Arundo donax TaxID=35708 RepID=A0A0A9EM54_ARUDO